MIDPNTIPAEVRSWWQSELRGHSPFVALVARARAQWPERDCGRDATRIMYGVAHDTEPAPAPRLVSVDRVRADLVSAARLIGLVGCLLDPWVDRIAAEIAQSGRAPDDLTVRELREVITRALSSLQVAA